MTTKPVKKSAAKRPVKKPVKKTAAKKKKVAKNPAKKASRKAPTAARLKAGRKDALGLVIEKVKSNTLTFPKSQKGSMYEPVLVKVRALTPGNSVKVKIPKNAAPADFRIKISAAVRKRLTSEEIEKVGKLRTRMVVDPKTDRATHVAVICSA